VVAERDADEPDLEHLAEGSFGLHTYLRVRSSGDQAKHTFTDQPNSYKLNNGDRSAADPRHGTTLG
jgi:hypothetical protein